MISSCEMPSNKKKAPSSERDYAVGDRVRVNLHTGRIVDATIKAIIERTGGKRLQVDVGRDETALVYLWQVIERIR
jgi:Mechanosensitive ion channel, beta-domain